MDLLTKENISLLLGLIGTIPVFKGSIIYIASWNKKRKMAAIEKEISRITKMRDSDREFYMFLFQSGFTIFAFFSISLMFSSLLSHNQLQGFYDFIQFFIGTAAYFVSTYTIGLIRRVKNSENTLKELQNRFEILNKS